MVEIDFTGMLAGFINATNQVVISVANTTRITVVIYDTELITVNPYELVLEIRYADELITKTIPVNITSPSLIPDDDDTKPTDTPTESGGLSKWHYLLFALTALLILAAVGILLILRRRRGKEVNDDTEEITSDIIKPEESPFSQPHTDPQQQAETPSPQFAPSVKHSSYMARSDRAVPGAFAVPPQPPVEEIPSVDEILAPPKQAEVRQIPHVAGTSPAPPSPPPKPVPIPQTATAPPRPVPSGPQIVGVDSRFSVHDMFLIYVDGRLVKSVSSETKLSEGMDEDIMSGMLTAITDFIRDSFNEESGALKSLQYGKLNIYIERGVGMYLAVVFHGEPPHNLREKMRWLLIRLWEKYKLKLKVWDGSMDGLDDLDKMLNSLLDQTEPQADSPAPSPGMAARPSTGPVVSIAMEAVMCGICMGVVKPGLDIITCPCGNRYHKACGDRVQICPKCGISLSVPPQAPQFPVGVEGIEGSLRSREDAVPLPHELMPPPPEEVTGIETKMLPEYSGQVAGERNQFRI